MRTSYKVLAVIGASLFLYVLPAGISRGGFSLTDGVAERVQQIKETPPKVTTWRGYAAEEFHRFAGAGAHIKSMQLFCKDEGRMPIGSVILYRGASPLAQEHLRGVNADIERLAPAISGAAEVLQYQRFSDSAADESRKLSYEKSLAGMWSWASPRKEGVATPSFHVCASNAPGKNRGPESLAAVGALANGGIGTDATGLSWNASVGRDRPEEYLLKATATNPAEEGALLRRYAQLKEELEHSGKARQLTEVTAVTATGEEALLLGDRTYEYTDQSAVTMTLTRSRGPLMLYVTYSLRSPYLPAGKRP